MRGGILRCVRRSTATGEHRKPDGHAVLPEFAQHPPSHSWCTVKCEIYNKR